MSDCKRIVFLLCLGLLNAESYVLVQVRKDQNKSNVDALIHKVVPSKKFEEIAETARKQFKNFKQFTITHKPHDRQLDSIVFAIKTQQDGGRRQDGGQPLSDLVTRVLNFLMPDEKNFPYYKSQMQKYNIKPQLVKLRNSNGKPSVMYEVDANSVLRSLKEALASTRLRRGAARLASAAAAVYRTVKEEIDKQY